MVGVVGNEYDSYKDHLSTRSVFQFSKKKLQLRMDGLTKSDCSSKEKNSLKKIIESRRYCLISYTLHILSDEP